MSPTNNNLNHKSLNKNNGFFTRILNKPSKFILISFIFVISTMLFFQVLITQQKYTIISLNSKISKTITERENLEMDKSLLLSKERLRELALNKLKMIPVESLETSIKAQMLE